MPALSLGERIIEARQKQGMTKAELARKASLSSAAIGFLESGSSKSIAGENLFPISDALNVSARWLITGRQPKPIDGAVPSIQEREEVVLLARHLATLEPEKIEAAMILLGVRRETDRGRV